MKMNCEKTQELLLTDYADGELSEEMRRAVDEHIGSCPACRQFATAVRVNVSEPLAAASKREPPAYILERVKAEIADGKEARFGFREHVSEIPLWLAGAINRLPRPAVVLVATAMIIIAVVIAHPIAQRRAVNEYLSEQITYMANLDSEEANGTTMFDTDIGTGAERLL